jgi:hypothetical protein
MLLVIAGVFQFGGRLQKTRKAWSDAGRRRFSHPLQAR